MNIKGIICTVIAAASVAAFSGAAVYADVISVPDNAFCRSAYQSCEYINWRSYDVLEDSNILKSPLKTTVVNKVKKGDIVDIGFTYTDKSGDVWGCCMFDERSELGRSKDGWIKMSKVSEIYSTFTFIDEHSDEFTDYSGELDNYIPQEKVVLWEYPYSENCYSVKAEDWFTKENYPFKNEIADKCWTDENGNMWIYSGKWATKDFGYNDRWVFLPDPETTDLSNFGNDISANEGTAVSGQLVDEMTENAREFAERSVNPAGRSLMLPAALSAGAAVASVMLIKAMKK